MRVLENQYYSRQLLKVLLSTLISKQVNLTKTQMQSLVTRSS